MERSIVAAVAEFQVSRQSLPQRQHCPTTEEESAEDVLTKKWQRVMDKRESLPQACENVEEEGGGEQVEEGDAEMVQQLMQAVRSFVQEHGRVPSQRDELLGG